jgi:hypothetical protein
MAGYGNIANLKHFGPDHKPPKYSAVVAGVITKCRKVTPELFDFFLDTVRDEEAPLQLRLRAAELLFERGMPKNDGSLTAQFALGEGGGLTVRLEIVDAVHDRHETETITITPNGHDDTRDEPISLSIADDGRDGR